MKERERRGAEVLFGRKWKGVARTGLRTRSHGIAMRFFMDERAPEAVTVEKVDALSTPRLTRRVWMTKA